MRYWLSILLSLVCLGNAVAADVTENFSLANKLYAQGKFADAAALYEKIIASGSTSANLFCNYGNAEFKAGNLGKAVAAFRHAELLAPRDAEIRANLNFVREHIQGSTAHESIWERWLGNLSLNEWTMLAAIAFWVALAFLILKQIRPALASKLRTPFVVAGFLTILLAAVVVIQAENHFSEQTAVVTSSEANALTGPFDDAQHSFLVRDGAELHVLARHDDWIQVADSSGKIGWLYKKQVEILPDA